MIGNFSGGSFSGAVGGFSVDPVPYRAGLILGLGMSGLRTREQIKRARKRVGIDDPEELAAALIAEVAAQQVLRLELDKQKQFEELERELQIRDIQLTSEHLQELNVQRERLINAEIGLRIRQKLQDEEFMTLLLIAAMVS